MFNRTMFLPQTNIYSVPPRTNGFAAYSPTPSSIVVSWKQNTATIEYYRVSHCYENAL